MSTATPMALAKPSASAPPWLLTQMPSQAEEDGAVVAARIERARAASQRAARRRDSRCAPTASVWKAARRNSVKSLAVPSAVLSATLPVKPSVTTTSTVPAPMSSPSTKPWKWMGEPAPRSRARGAAHRVVALQILGADIEQADGRLRSARARCARRRRPSARTARGCRRRIRHWRRDRASRSRRAASGRTTRSPAGRCPAAS